MDQFALIGLAVMLDSAQMYRWSTSSVPAVMTLRLWSYLSLESTGTIAVVSAVSACSWSYQTSSAARVAFLSVSYASTAFPLSRRYLPCWTWRLSAFAEMLV